MGFSTMHHGGALYVESTIVHIYQSAFSACTAQQYGGAVYGSFGDTALYIHHSVFVDNDAKDGGAIFSSSYLEGENNEFANNRALGRNGGSILQQQNGHVASIFGSNYLLNSRNTVFANNTAVSHGGAVCSSAGFVLWQCVFRNNTNAQIGGAIVLLTVSP